MTVTQALIRVSATALVVVAPAHAMPADLDPGPAEGLAPIVERAHPAVTTGATRTTDESVRSDGADDTKAYLRCDDGDLYAVPRDRVAEFAAGMAELGYACEPIEVDDPAPPAVEVADPQSFDRNGDEYIVWHCPTRPADIPAPWLVAPYDVFVTYPELMAGWACVPVADA